ncbi:DUF2087 domain-containing protein [Priestia megaterium]|nr:DUF2087 domain-containing protein [Priestia megaterium]
MMISERFLEASLNEMKQGYAVQEHECICLLCGEVFEKGIIYPEDGVLYEAERYAKLHVEKVHQSVFHYLMKMDKDVTGLSEHQKSLLELFYQGKSDAEIKEKMGIGSSSTIRNHRFTLKKKEKQAKVFLTLMELLNEHDKKASSSRTLKPQQSVEARYDISAEEHDQVIAKNFPKGIDGPLCTFNLKEKHRIVVLQAIAKRFEGNKVYHEKEVNDILQLIYEDYVLVRRFLIEYGFFKRNADGSAYWKEEDIR